MITQFHRTDWVIEMPLIPICIVVSACNFDV
jgi:hypothetical protein